MVLFTSFYLALISLYLTSLISISYYYLSWFKFALQVYTLMHNCVINITQVTMGSNPGWVKLRSYSTSV